MKKLMSRSLVLVASLVMCASQVFAFSDIGINMNGKKVTFTDSTPYLDENNRVLVPVRFVSEKLGARVEWDVSTKNVTILNGKNIAILTIDSEVVTINGVTKKLDTCAVIKGTRTYVPLRFVGESLGADVKWDNKTKTITINNAIKK